MIFAMRKILTVEVLINDAGVFVFGEVAGIDYSRVKSMIILHTLTPDPVMQAFWGTDDQAEKRIYTECFISQCSDAISWYFTLRTDKSLSASFHACSQN